VSNTQAVIAPVHKALVVDCSPERAFEVFTRGLGTWWPLGMHSIGGERITEVVFEEQVGGRIFERHDDGGEGEWGRVLAWEPPTRFVMTWYPGHDSSEATELEVCFAAEGDGTRVDLEHRGWEILAGRAQETRSGYDSGWGEVLSHYTRHFARVSGKRG
jgi:uncharacterized protein YndB with AHSA1/START domain